LASISGDAAVSVVVPWCDRPELSETIAKNMAQLEPVSAEFVLVNCGGDLENLIQMLPSIAQATIRIIDILGVEYNKCLAINIASQYCRGSHLLLLDADIILGKGICENINETKKGAFLTLGKVQENNAKKSEISGNLSHIRYSMTIQFKSGAKAEVETKRLFLSPAGRSGPGIVLVGKKDFEAIGGMDSGCIYWGWEDIDLILRLQFSLRLERKQRGYGIHISHSDLSRNVGEGLSKEQCEALNFAYCLSKYSKGEFAGTLHDDLSSCRHSVVMSIPK